MDGVARSAHEADTMPLTVHFPELTVEFSELTVQFSKLTVEFSESTVEFPDLTGLTRFTGLVLMMGGVLRLA